MWNHFHQKQVIHILHWFNFSNDLLIWGSPLTTAMGRVMNFEQLTHRGDHQESQDLCWAGSTNQKHPSKLPTRDRCGTLCIRLKTAQFLPLPWMELTHSKRMGQLLTGQNYLLAQHLEKQGGIFRPSEGLANFSLRESEMHDDSPMTQIKLERRLAFCGLGCA